MASRCFWVSLVFCVRTADRRDETDERTDLRSTLDRETDVAADDLEDGRRDPDSRGRERVLLRFFRRGECD